MLGVKCLGGGILLTVCFWYCRKKAEYGRSLAVRLDAWITLLTYVRSQISCFGRPLQDILLSASPFCGSGTIPIEAALYATNTAPGIKRNFAAQTWRDVIPKNMWLSAREEALDNRDMSVICDIQASDIDPKAIEIAKQNAKNAGVYDKIRFSVCDCAKLKPFKEKGVIICNPPYGERLSDVKSCKKLYQMMGKKFATFTEAKKFIMTSYDEFEKYYGKEADKRRKLYNGMLRCYVYQYFK